LRRPFAARTFLWRKGATGKQVAQINLSFFPASTRLMKGARFCGNGVRAAFAARSKLEEILMSRKPQKTIVRKPAKKIADSRRVRFGGSWAPASLRK
jgi:hypothetical protein